MTINNKIGLIESCNWNEYNMNPLMRIHLRASLVPTTSVISAPIAYILVVVKKLVVGPWGGMIGLPYGVHLSLAFFDGDALLALTGKVVPPALLL